MPATAHARYLVCTERGRVIRTANTKRWWNDARQNAKLTHSEGDSDRPLWLYDLRHTYASLMAQAGADITWLARQMGHESPKIIYDTYIHLYPGSGKKALEALSGMIEGQRTPEIGGKHEGFDDAYKAT